MKYITVRPNDGSFCGWLVVDESMREEIIDASPTLLNFVGDRWDDFRITAHQNGWTVEQRDQIYDRG